MAHVKVTRGNGEVTVDKEASVVVTFVMEDDGVGSTCAIEGASTVEVAAVIDSMEKYAVLLKNKFPAAALLVEFGKQADELKKEDEGVTDD